MKKIRVHANNLVFDVETDKVVDIKSKHRLQIGDSILHFSVNNSLYILSEQEQIPSDAPAPEGSIKYLRERGQLV